MSHDLVAVPGGVSPGDFLTSIYGDGAEEHIWTCAFSNFPGNWTGRMGWAHLSGLDTDRSNFFFCIGEMNPAAPRRSNDEVIRQRVIIADDIGTKADKGVWETHIALGFPEPTFCIETSPGNETWGWVLDQPVEPNTDAWDDVTRLRAWLTEKGLTDPGVADAARYIRLPLGWNSKDKYVDDGGNAPRVKLLMWNRDHTVSLDEMGQALLARPDWRLVPLPLRAQVGADLARNGALTRTADLNQPEPLMVLWQEMGGNLRQTRPGVVEADCPNIAEHTHDGREGTGFAFLGGGIMRCSHGHCQHLSTPGFKQMMLERFDEWAAGRRALGLDVPLGAADAQHFLTLTDLKARGALDGEGVEDAFKEAEALAARQADAAEAAAEELEDKLAALSHRFVWIHSLQMWFDVKERTLTSLNGINTHPAVLSVIPSGTPGKKSAHHVLLNRGEHRRDALGIVYKPGQGSAVVVAEDEQGNLGPHVNTWRATTLGRRKGTPSRWLSLAEHLMPDEGYREWLLDWLGWVIQNPDQRSPVVPVLVSGQGAGKDVFLAVISHVIGLQNFLKLRPAELSSDFNGWVRRRFVHLDEVRFDGAGKAYNTIKSLTGQSKGGRVRVNEKFKESYSIEFAGVFFATTNEASALKGIEHDDRRFAGYCSPAGRLDEIWGEDEFDEVSSIAEAERVHEFLLTRDVSTFNAYQPPKDDTGSRTEIITASLTEAGIEAYNLVTSGEFAERELFTLVEVMDHLVRHPNPTVRNRLTQHAVRQGLLAAECEQCHGGKLVRSDGKLVRIWVNGTVDESERVYLIGKHPTRGAPAPKELATRMAEDREAAATRLQEQLLGLSGT